MTECRRLWTADLPPYPAAQEEALCRAAADRVRDCAVCFWLFRFLHAHGTPEAALLGDYCFGRFSKHLAALDSVALNDAFAAYLRADTLAPRGFSDYLAFAAGLGGDL